MIGPEYRQQQQQQQQQQPASTAAAAAAAAAAAVAAQSQFGSSEAELLPSIYDFNFTAAVNASNGWSEMWQNHFANGHAFDHIPI